MFLFSKLISHLNGLLKNDKISLFMYFVLLLADFFRYYVILNKVNFSFKSN
jgi:hypothetical protein